MVALTGMWVAKVMILNIGASLPAARTAVAGHVLPPWTTRCLTTTTLKQTPRVIFVD